LQSDPQLVSKAALAAARIDGTPYGFPWGSNHPTTSQRICVAGITAVIAALALSYRLSTGHLTDFHQVLFGARAMLEGRNPYELVGHGREFVADFGLLYPATSFLMVLPLAFITATAATIVFVAVSVFLLTYAVATGSWHRLPMLGSAAFADTVISGQWSAVLVAALFLPALAVFVPAKPQLGAAVLAGTRSRFAWLVATLSGVVLVSISLYFLPDWPADWFRLIQADTSHMKAAVTQPFGAAVLLLLLRWKRPEAWVVLITACLPQTLMWYSFLVLLAFPATYREACVLSLVSSAGFLIAQWIAAVNPVEPRTGTILWTVVVITTFLPVSIAILRRPNEGELPAWLQQLTNYPPYSRRSLPGAR